VNYLLLSDIHANLEALEAVLDADGTLPPPDAVLVLGDLVGYGPDPAAVIHRIRQLAGPLLVIRGNHDRVVAGIDSGVGFNEDARSAARWSREAMSPDDQSWLAMLPRGPLALTGGEVAAHGSPLDEDQYLYSAGDIRQAFGSVPAPVIFCGHTHQPLAAVLEEGRCTVRLLLRPKEELVRRPGQRLLFNPGSVGQPRDGDPRAAFARYDSESGRITFLRVAYDYRPTVRRMREAGLPDFLSRRLAAGR
jgi:diadenosine tetraphosphatase ApaH/serine/threonine PP2A family protein phosphatase